MLKRQKVQDASQVLSQPGLQAEEIDVEVSRLNTLGRLPEGVSLRGTETRVIKTPAHQAHLEEPVSPLKENRAPRLSSAGMLIAGHPAAQELVCHYLTDVCQAGEDVLAFGDGLDTVCPLGSCPEANVQFVPIQSHKMCRDFLLIQKFCLMVSTGATWGSSKSRVGLHSARKADWPGMSGHFHFLGQLQQGNIISIEL